MTPTTRIAYGMGIYDQHGKLRFVQISGDEDAAWQIYLGWPSEDEIKGKKQEGFHCQKVVIARR
jgi:hypothetical protein